MFDLYFHLELIFDKGVSLKWYNIFSNLNNKLFPALLWQIYTNSSMNLLHKGKDLKFGKNELANIYKFYFVYDRIQFYKHNHQYHSRICSKKTWLLTSTLFVYKDVVVFYWSIVTSWFVDRKFKMGDASHLLYKIVALEQL